MEIKTAVIDDDQEFLTSFSDYTAHTLGFSRPVCFNGARAFLKAMERQVFDIIIVDLMLGRSSGTDLIREIKALRSDARVLVLSGFSDDYLVGEAFRLGADGYLLKTQPMPQILQSIQSYYSGGVAVEATVMKKVLKKLRTSRSFDPSQSSLTSRECSILMQLASGRTYKDISVSLDVSPQTVYSHAKRLFRKLGVRSKTEAVVCYLSAGGATDESPNVIPNSGKT